MKRREGMVHIRAAWLFGSTGIVGALVGSQLTPLVPSSVLLLIFAGLMLAIAMRMLFGSALDEVAATAQCRPWRCGAAGAAVGLITGFLGVGGGFLIVPALTYFGRLPLKKAIGTSLVVIAVNSFAGLLGHLGQGGTDWKTTGTFLGMALLGMAVGVKFASAVSKTTLNRWFAWSVVTVAVFVLVKIQMNPTFN